MNENVARRVEKKYLITEKEKKLLLNSISDYIEEDEYYKSTICNIYFDNDNNDLIVNSLEKPKFKTKLRLRSYNIPTLDDYVFLEIKSKYNGIVGKRRIKICLKDYYDYINNNIYYDSQIMKEIDYYFKYYNLKPSIYLAYERECFIEKNNRNLRITFDSNLRSRFDNLRLETGSNGDKYFDEDIYIMEIKVLDAIPLWLVRCLSKLKIYPTSFSKVGKIYTKKGVNKSVN